ncbi:MAG: tetratricopeptide repeat protein [Sandaracinaceae bacterium]|nr:tetratricopeptide repeat protein [Sandaracinaceae bacterium]
MTTEAPKATAEGTLERTPFGHLLLYTLTHTLSGTIAVWPDSRDEGTRREDRILVREGFVVAARLSEQASTIERGLLPLFMRLDAPYAFYANVDLVGAGEAVRTGRVDPYALIAAHLRGPAREDVIDAVLSKVARVQLRLRGDVDLNRFAFLPAERAFVDVVRASPTTGDELLKASGTPERVARRVIYLLTITKSLEPVVARAAAAAVGGNSIAPAPISGAPASGVRPSMPVPTPPSNRPRRRESLRPVRPPSLPSVLPSEHTELWKEISRRAHAIDDQNYFEMLGLPKDALADKARDAYFDIIKRLHPDRLPIELAPLLPFAQRIFHHLTEAHETLSDEEKRLRYISIVRDGGGTPATDRIMSNILEATVEFQKAEVLMRRRDFAGAIEYLRNAIDLNATEADYHALYGWVLFQQHAEADAPLDDMLAAIDRALTIDAQNDRAHYYRGMVLRRMGRDSEAVAHFEKATAINPRNVDAMREVRLAAMRGITPSKRDPRVSSDPPKATSSGRPRSMSPRPKEKEEGLFSKLLGSKKKP